jgi:hypothetical protein
MKDADPVDLRALADVESPEVVHEALRRFRRRTLTRYLWVSILVVLIAAALFLGGRPSNLKEEFEAARGGGSSSAWVWRLDQASVGIEEFVDLGEDLGLHFVVVHDPDEPTVGVWVQGQVASMQWAEFDTYVRVPKPTEGTLRALIGSVDCLPSCLDQEAIEIDLGGFPPDMWRANA